MIDKFFNSEADRDLWLRLDAERQIEADKRSIYSNRLHPRSMEQALEIAQRGLERDKRYGVQLYTLEDLLTLSHDELEKKRLVKHQEFCRKFEML
jgi:hypothetical protein